MSRWVGGWVNAARDRAQQDASVKRVTVTQTHAVLHSDPSNLLLTKWLSVYWSYGTPTQLRPSRPDDTQSHRGLS